MFLLARGFFQCPPLPVNVRPRAKLRARIAHGGWRAASRRLALELCTAGSESAPASPVGHLALRRCGVDTWTSGSDSAPSPPALRLLGPFLRSRCRTVETRVAVLDVRRFGERFGASSFALPAARLAHSLRLRARCHIPPT
jgi:hypothetical protein